MAQRVTGLLLILNSAARRRKRNWCFFPFAVLGVGVYDWHKLLLIRPASVAFTRDRVGFRQDDGSTATAGGGVRGHGKTNKP